MVLELVEDYVHKYGAASIFVFEIIDELTPTEIYHMSYVNGIMLAKKGINTPQTVVIEETDMGDLLKFVLAGDASKLEKYIYRNILLGFFGKKHSYLGMSVNKNVP